MTRIIATVALLLAATSAHAQGYQPYGSVSPTMSGPIYMPSAPAYVAPVWSQTQSYTPAPRVYQAPIFPAGPYGNGPVTTPMGINGRPMWDVK